MAYKYPPALPHGPIQKVVPDIFLVRGTAKVAPLIAITRNMTVVRQGKDLTVINSVRLSPEGEAELERLGEVKHLVKLGYLHSSDDPYYKDKYKPTLWALPGATHKGGLVTDREMRPGGDLPIEGASLFVYENAIELEGAILIPREGGILLVCDSIQNWGDFDGCTPLGKLVMKAMGFSGRARIGPRWRKFVERKEGPTLAGDFERLLELPFQHILGAHGYPLCDTAKADLRATVRETYPEAKV